MFLEQHDTASSSKTRKVNSKKSNRSWEIIDNIIRIDHIIIHHNRLFIFRIDDLDYEIGRDQSTQPISS